jgi:prolipoprotein diacylglyceryltransferase
MVVLLWLQRRSSSRLRRGDSVLIFFMWYGLVRFALEFLRTGNWTIGGIATAQIFSTAFAIGALLIFVGRRLFRPGSPPPEPPGGEDEEASAEAAEAMVNEGGPA